MSRKISFFSLVILMIAAIDNIRNLSAAALFGSSLIFFLLFSAIIFLIPTSLVAAELAALFPEKGGVYHWVSEAFGKKWAMAAIWLQWINTMVWFPAMLSFIAGTLAYFFNPALAQNKIYLTSCILIIFWGLTLINLKGIHVSAILNNIFVTIGTIIPMIFLIVLGCTWYFLNEPGQIQFTKSQIFPSLTHSESWVSLVAIMASFLGMELSGVHINDIENPQKRFPKAVLIACIFIIVSMLLGSLSIAYVLPVGDINIVSGVMQLFDKILHLFGLQQLLPLLTLLIVAGSIGTMINWLISPAKGLLHAAEFGFLPPFFTKKNSSKVASNILLMQAVLVTLFCIVFHFVPGVNAFYWFLTALSTELYMIMYILMFAACIKLHYRYQDRPTTFKIPGKHWGMWITALVGLFGCSITIVISFFAPETIDVGSPMRYFSMIAIGNVITISPLIFFFMYEKKRRALK